jgi:hypothetical protein
MPPAPPAKKKSSPRLHSSDEDEFRQKFRLVTFAIFSDHNSHREHNPDGNIFPFWETFEQ